MVNAAQMPYIRKHRKGGRNYYALVESHQVEGRIRQHQLAWLGAFPKALQVVERDYPELRDRLMKHEGLAGVETPQRKKAREYTKAERNCWKTPNTPDQPVISLVQQALGGTIGLDPTADDARSVPANRHITAAEDCFTTGWDCQPSTAFMNPPYDKPHLYLARLVQAIEGGEVGEAIALCKLGVLANQKSGAIIKDSCAAFCIWGAGTGPRMGFVDADGYQVTGADFDTVLIYWGSQVKRFARVFKAWGAVSRPYPH